MNQYLEIIFSGLQPEQQEMLIAHLSESGFEGFQEDGEDLKAYIPAAAIDRTWLQELIFKYQLKYSEQVIPEQNWNHSWESSFQPVQVDDFVAIRADFHPPVKGVELEIIITPKMSFGTGHHATTYMMVQQMREMDLRGKNVFDFGTGTGVLSILAEKRGAATVDAIDNDDWSIANAAENLEANHCQRVRLTKAAALKTRETYDIILANINKNVILDHFMELAGHLKKPGTLLLSGLLTGDEPAVLQQAEQYGLRLRARSERQNWICLQLNH